MTDQALAVVIFLSLIGLAILGLVTGQTQETFFIAGAVIIGVATLLYILFKPSR